MNTCRHSWQTLVVVSLVVAAISGTVMSDDVFRIASPSSFADTEGGALGRPTDDPTRIQFLIPATDFAELPESHRLIVGWNFRADASQGESVDWSYANVKMLMSTTDKTPLTLTSRFDANHGENKTLVLDGPATFPLLATGPLEGPRDFADGPQLQTPFYYDPAQGNLLLELVRFDVSPIIPHIDAHPLDEPGATVVLNTSSATSAFGTLVNQPAVLQFEFIPSSPIGDLNRDGAVDVLDIDQLWAAIRVGESSHSYDLNADGNVDFQDGSFWVHEVKRTWFGDANLDGEFNSGDLVAAIGAGQYEDSLTGNSGWATGDWDGDGDFTTADLVIALGDGGYELGPAAAISAVPEPASFTMFLLTWMYLTIQRSIRRR